MSCRITETTILTLFNVGFGNKSPITTVLTSLVNFNEDEKPLFSPESFSLVGISYNNSGFISFNQDLALKQSKPEHFSKNYTLQQTITDSVS